MAASIVGVAVEVLLDLGEVIHRADRALRGKQQLRVVAAHGRRVDAQARVVRPRVGRELDGAVGVAVDVAREARHALGGLGSDAVVRDVEPGGLERRDQQPQPVELLGGEEAVHHVEVVAVGDLDAAGDVAELGVRGQVERRRELRQVAVRDVEADVEPLVLRDARAVHCCGKSMCAVDCSGWSSGVYGKLAVRCGSARERAPRTPPSCWHPAAASPSARLAAACRRTCVPAPSVLQSSAKRDSSAARAALSTAGRCACILAIHRANGMPRSGPPKDVAPLPP